MKLLFSVFVISCLVFSSFRPISWYDKPTTDYDVYLNRLIELQKTILYDNKPLKFPVKIIVVSPLLGANLRQDNFSSLFDYLNTHFHSAHLTFEQVGEIDYIFTEKPLDTFYENQRAEQVFVRSHLSEPQVINLYIFEKADKILGYTHYPNKNLHRVFIAKEKLLDPSLIHEMGHYFGLLHTFEHTVGRLELVNDANCQYNGDKICDTPADPVGASFLEDECKLFGEYRDKNGQLFKPNMSNFMSYYGRCRAEFSTEQAERMYFIARKIKAPQLGIASSLL